MQEKLKYEVPTYHNWSQLAKFYHPLQAGSIDGTDMYPHDKGIWRALLAKYKPNKRVQGDPDCTLFVGKLSKDTKEATLIKCFSKYGNIKKCRVIRDIVTGHSKGYAFIEYDEERDAKIAYREMYKTDIDGREILVEYELERNLKDWIPRRLGGGFGGKKESGQLRFGGRDRPFRRPIPTKAMGQGNRSHGNTYGSDQDRDYDRDKNWTRSFNRDSDNSRDRDYIRDRDYSRDRSGDRSFERETDGYRDRSNVRQNERDDKKGCENQKDRLDNTRDRRRDKHNRDKDRHRERSHSLHQDHSRHDSHRKKDGSRRKDREHRRDKTSKS